MCQCLKLICFYFSSLKLCEKNIHEKPSYFPLQYRTLWALWLKRRMTRKNPPASSCRYITSLARLLPGEVGDQVQVVRGEGEAGESPLAHLAIGGEGQHRSGTANTMQIHFPAEQIAKSEIFCRYIAMAGRTFAHYLTFLGLQLEKSQNKYIYTHPVTVRR